MAAFWQVTYNGVTKDASAWGIAALTRRRKSAETDLVKFKLDGTAFDTHPLPFAWRQPLSIARNGVPWFSGVVTKPEPKASGKAESINYEISGPWYWLEKTVFQQMWVTLGSAQVTGQPTATQTTTRSESILGQALDGIKINSGQVMMEVLLYAQYAFQMQPFPSTVTLAHLPPAPNPANGPLPFLIGTITPSITVPYMTVRDKSCADIIRLLMKYSPDAVAWMDYSTHPPTINIGQRAGLQKKTVSVLNGTTKFVTGLEPTPRYDLQVPVVVAKFEEKGDINGATWDSLNVQVYPPAPAGVDPGVWASQPLAWVQTIDLIGGHTTTQTADIGVIARPITVNDVNAMNWVLYKESWLKQRNAANAPVWDSANITLAFLNTVIDPNDPLNKPSNNPNNITINGGVNDCPQLINELIPGAFPPWLQEDPNDLDAAKVQVEVWLKYSGSDPATAAQFWFDPSNPLTPRTDGSGFLVRFYNIKATNADTETYSQLTSWAAGEPVPTGFAQALYTSLAQLHFQGSLITVEQECSDMLPPGSTFNTTDGNPDWQEMDALVIEVSEDIENGTTTVDFGPPSFLTLEEMEQLFRANLGVLPSYKLDQRTTGMLTAGSNVIGAEHSADTNTVHVPTPSVSGYSGPFAVKISTPTPGVFKATVGFGQVFSDILETSSLAITGLNVAGSVTGNEAIWLEGDLTANTITVFLGSAAPTPLEYSGTYPAITQTFWRSIIAQLTPGVGGKPPTVKQLIESDLGMIFYTDFSTGPARPAAFPQAL